jgi:hypothetical protein
MGLFTYLNMLFDNRLMDLEKSKNLELKRLEETITNLSAYIKELELNFQEIISSNSWKLTGPLRKLAKIFK